jgi:hypothetical protein
MQNRFPQNPISGFLPGLSAIMQAGFFIFGGDAPDNPISCRVRIISCKRADDKG